MKQCFPNCDIIGNHDKPGAHLENFDVYIRGVGPEHDRDEQGRIILYQKNEGIFSFLYNFPRRILKVRERNKEKKIFSIVLSYDIVFIIGI